MKTTLTLIYGVSAVLLLSGAAARADTARSRQLPSPDNKFVEDAMAGGTKSIQMGELAAQKGKTPMVREYGMRMTQDHAAANEELGRILTEQGVAEPVPAEKTTKMPDRLQRLSGTDFDHAYIKDALKDSENNIAEFKKEATKGKDPEIRNWAAQTMTLMEDHMHMAKEAQANIPVK